jgi:hypothetical protein
MTILLSPIGNSMQPFVGNDTLPLAGGLLYTYQAGSSTSAPAYTNINGDILCSNPIVLGVNGIPPTEIWLSNENNYKFVLTDSSNNTLYTYDNIGGIPSAASITNVPSGAIFAWSGTIATIPTGYLICNGLNGTPNLLDCFIVGAGKTFNVNSAGGFVSPDTITTTGTNIPTYYALAYIQKT